MIKALKCTCHQSCSVRLANIVQPRNPVQPSGLKQLYQAGSLLTCGRHFMFFLFYISAHTKPKIVNMYKMERTLESDPCFAVLICRK